MITFYATHRKYYNISLKCYKSNNMNNSYFQYNFAGEQYGKYYHKVQVNCIISISREMCGKLFLCYSDSTHGIVII